MMMNEEKELTPDMLWQVAKTSLQNELPKVTFDTWVKPIRFASYQADTFLVSCVNEYGRDWVETHITGRANAS
jgi:hypothetical protein